MNLAMGPNDVKCIHRVQHSLTKKSLLPLVGYIHPMNFPKFIDTSRPKPRLVIINAHTEKRECLRYLENHQWTQSKEDNSGHHTIKLENVFIIQIIIFKSCPLPDPTQYHHCSFGLSKSHPSLSLVGLQALNMESHIKYLPHPALLI